MKSFLSVIPIVVAGLAGGVVGVAGAAEGKAMDSDSTVGPPGFVYESSLPAGFPEPGPIERAVVKRYPAARAVQTETGQFMRLFGHISRERVSMTTPVMMTPNDPSEPRPDRGGMSMAFFYPSTQTGEAGPDGFDDTVEVVDMGQRTVISYAFFGNPSWDQVDAARAAIAEQAEAKGLEPTGVWSLMGYNSPNVPPARRLYEVQQEVATPSAAEADAEPATP
ncbi:MAG: heme-binding protein [Planctomycetota bacterium]